MRCDSMEKRVVAKIRGGNDLACKVVRNTDKQRKCGDTKRHSLGGLCKGCDPSSDDVRRHRYEQTCYGTEKICGGIDQLCLATEMTCIGIDLICNGKALIR